MAGAVRRNSQLERFELDVEGHTAVAYYRLAPGVITFTHTEVPPELGGRGIGSQLARGALDAVRAEGLKVIPECPFIRGYIGKHAEYADLLAPGVRVDPPSA
jgi:predicted GNAT family acetyltransferase